MATPAERDRLLRESLAGSGSVRLAAAPGGKYYIYSSAHAAGGASARTLAAGTNIDNFVTLLKDQQIILTAAPTDDNLVGQFDGLDAWAGWMTCLDAEGTLSLTFNNAKDQDITSFRYRFTQPWDMTFSSQADALLFAFGTQAGVSDTRVPVPGLMPDGKLLYFALDPAATKNSLNSTVGHLAAFSGTDTALPSAMADWKLVLDPSKASQKRNAMWFDPGSMQTTVRLQFTVADGQQTLAALLGGVLPGLVFDSVEAVCKKTLVLAETESGAGAVQNGLFSLQVGCTATATKGPDPVQMTASVDCFQAGYSLSLQLTTKNALAGLLAWLSELIGVDDLDVIQDVLEKGSIFDDLNPRRLQIGLDTDYEDGKTSMTLSSFRVEIEVSARFGKSASEPVVFLVSYTWTRAAGGAGTLSGQFWNWFDTSPTRNLSPTYESVQDIVPTCIADNPAQKISILSLIPGQTIDNVPANIPTEISRAYFSLSQTGILLGGVIQSDAWSSPEEYSVPQLDLGVVTLNASYAWGQAANYQFSLGVLVEMKPGTASKHQTSAYLKGSLDYSSQDKQWTLRAVLNGLYASTLYEFFDESSADHVMPFVDSIEIANMELTYDYTAGKTAGQSAGSHFKFDGFLLVAALQLKLAFEYTESGWTFSAQLAAQNGQATMRDVLQSMLGDSNLDLPDFLANMPFDNKQGHAIDIEIKKGSSNQGGSSATFQFLASLSLGPLQLTFAQLHGSQWPATEPSKRLVKVALTELPSLDIALVGRLEQPFDEMYYMWIQDPTTQNKAQVPAGLTRGDIDALNPSLGDYPLVAKDKFQTPKPEDLLMTAGSHFAIIIEGINGKTCILDYDFKKQTETEEPQSKGTGATATKEPDTAESGENDSDGNSSEAALKKKAGPLSISNIGLKYSDKTLHIKLDATLELGPLAFSLLGFGINLTLTSLDLSKIEFPSFSLDGFSAELDKAPLTIAGIIRHGQDSTLNYYAGGLIVGWVPWQLEAAGFYGEATPQGAAPFTSVFVFARLDGPLVTLEFAEISGVTGGFGYKSQVRVPAIDQVENFPFIATHTLDGATDNALQALERLTSPSQDGWFQPLDDTYWGAAGMKVDAFGMISLDAVVVVQFGSSVKLGVFGVALADIPSAKSPLKLAHVELGIAVTVDPDIGLLQVEAQLSPNSYVLNPSCHLTGGFALCYWYDGPHANKDLVGNFVFTLGGYHQAFLVPKGWPNPPRLGISWRLGDFLSISGEAFFAITPKACMAGGRLKASFSAGPLAAWFDAYANFLINYKPFNFYAEAGICVGVSFDIDFLFIHIHISVEISADLDLWGPPMAGSVHIDIKVATITVHFGDRDSGPAALSLLEFYHLALQASSQQQQSLQDPAAAVAEAEADNTQPPNQGHVFLAQTGLMNDSDKPDREQNQAWVVRGGNFSCVVGCKMAIGSATLIDQDGQTLNSVAYADNAIYAKPMHLENPLQSDLQIKIVQDGVPEDDVKWGMDKVLKSVPTGLWARYDESKDPTRGGGGNNNIEELLKPGDGGVSLMMGVLLTAPPPVLSQDRLPVFDISDAELEEVDGNPFPSATPSQDTWKPDSPAPGSEQWDAVHGKWKTPSWDPDGGDGVQKHFVQTWCQAFNWDGALAQLARLPKLLDKRFNEIYIAVPLMTK